MRYARHLLFSLLLLPTLSFATSEPAPNPLQEPSQALRAGIELLTGFLDQHPQRNPVQLQKFLETRIVPHFNFKRMAKRVAGPLRRYLNAGQQQRLEVTLKARFLSAMTKQLVSYRQARVEYLRPRGNYRRGDVTLGVRVYSRYQPAVQIDFRLSQTRHGWKVYDVLANRLSAVKYYRDEFKGIANRYGIEGLISHLQ